MILKAYLQGDGAETQIRVVSSLRTPGIMQIKVCVIGGVIPCLSSPTAFIMTSVPVHTAALCREVVPT